MIGAKDCFYQCPRVGGIDIKKQAQGCVHLVSILLVLCFNTILFVFSPCGEQQKIEKSSRSIEPFLSLESRPLIIKTSKYCYCYPTQFSCKGCARLQDSIGKPQIKSRIRKKTCFSLGGRSHRTIYLGIPRQDPKEVYDFQSNQVVTASIHFQKKTLQLQVGIEDFRLFFEQTPWTSRPLSHSHASRPFLPICTLLPLTNSPSEEETEYLHRRSPGFSRNRRLRH